jgi:hypothetical protein
MLNVIPNTSTAEAIAESVRTGKRAALNTRGPLRDTHRAELAALAPEVFDAFSGSFTYHGPGWTVRLG